MRNMAPGSSPMRFPSDKSEFDSQLRNCFFSTFFCFLVRLGSGLLVSLWRRYSLAPCGCGSRVPNGIKCGWNQVLVGSRSGVCYCLFARFLTRNPESNILQLVVLDDSILWVILPFKNIIFNNAPPILYIQSYGCTEYSTLIHYLAH